jgi:hypothetical protein
MVEQRLRTLGEKVSSLLTTEQQSWYDEFLEAGEWGIALEMAADWLSEEETPLADDIRTEMIDLARGVGNEDRVAGPLRLCPPAL